MKWPGTRAFVKKLVQEWSEDSIADTAAALSYYGILALFPFLLFVVAMVGVVLDPYRLRDLLKQLQLVAPPDVTSIIGTQLDLLLRGRHAGLLTFGVLAALWAVSGGISSLMQALDRSYDIGEARPFWKKRSIALGSTLVAAFASLLLVVVMIAMPLLGKWLGGPLGAAVTWGRFVVAGVILLGLFAYLYWALPNVRPRFQLLTPGSLFGVCVWLIASWGFSEYVRHFGHYKATYGALGGMIVLLVWMWLSAVVLLVGAEINKILTPSEKLKRSPTGETRRGEKEPAPAAQPRKKDRPEPQPA
jgi:membrane protein